MAKVFPLHAHPPQECRRGGGAATKAAPTTPPVQTKRSVKLPVRKLRLLICGLVLGALFLTLWRNSREPGASLSRHEPEPGAVSGQTDLPRRARRAFMVRCGLRLGAAIGRNPCQG